MAIILKKTKVITAVFSEAMGHESERVTEIYLESFENEELDRMNEMLLSICISINKFKVNPNH